MNTHDFDRLPIVHREGDEIFVGEVMEKVSELQEELFEEEEEEEEEEKEQEEYSETQEKQDKRSSGARTAPTHAAKLRMLERQRSCTQESEQNDLEQFFKEIGQEEVDMDLSEFDIIDAGEEGGNHAFSISDYEKRVAKNVYDVFVGKVEKEKVVKKVEKVEKEKVEKRRSRKRKKTWEMAKEPMKNVFSS